MQGQFFTVPTAEELRAFHTAYERVEPRSLFYRVAVELVESAWRGQSLLSLAEAVTVLLKTWNRSFYQYRSFDEQHFSQLEALLDSFQESLAGYRQRGIGSLAGQDETPVKEIFTAFEKLLGHVGTAKCLHLMVLRFFPLWNKAIAAGYGLLLGRVGQNAGKH